MQYIFYVDKYLTKSPWYGYNKLYRTFAECFKKWTFLITCRPSFTSMLTFIILLQNQFQPHICLEALLDEENSRVYFLISIDGSMPVARGDNSEIVKYIDHC